MTRFSPPYPEELPGLLVGHSLALHPEGTLEILPGTDEPTHWSSHFVKPSSELISLRNNMGMLNLTFEGIPEFHDETNMHAMQLFRRLQPASRLPYIAGIMTLHGHGEDRHGLTPEQAQTLSCVLEGTHAMPAQRWLRSERVRPFLAKDLLDALPHLLIKDQRERPLAPVFREAVTRFLRKCESPWRVDTCAQALETEDISSVTLFAYREDPRHNERRTVTVQLNKTTGTTHTLPEQRWVEQNIGGFRCWQMLEF